MFEPELIQIVAPLGVGGVLAVIMFYFYRKDAETYTSQWKGQSELLMEVVKENTKAITSNTEVVRALRVTMQNGQDIDERRDDERRDRDGK